MNYMLSAQLARLARHVAAPGASRVDFAVKVSLLVVGVLVVLLVAQVVYALWFRRFTVHRDGRLVSKRTVFTWLLGASGIVTGLFWLGYSAFLDEIVPPASAYEIQALSAKNAWQFLYPTGKHSLNRLVVPTDRPVRLVLSSKDVEHSFFVPQLGLQQTALPGRYTSLWFQAPRRQTLSIGDGRTAAAAKTSAVLDVIDASSFELWLSTKDPNFGPSEAR